MIEYTEYTKMLIGLIAIVNPIGAVPIFISLTTGLDDKARRTIYRTTTYAVFLILMAALILGEAILDFFGITISSFRVAGGILTVKSELGEPIHKVANRATLLWRELDQQYFSLPRDARAAAVAKSSGSTAGRSAICGRCVSVTRSR